VRAPGSFAIGSETSKRISGAAGIVAAAIASAVVGAALVAVSVAYGGNYAPAVLLGVPLLAIYAVVVVNDPKWGVIGVFATFPLGTLEIPGFPLEIVELAALSVAALLAVNRMSRGLTPLPWVHSLWWGLALIGWALICLESALAIDLGIKQILQLVGGLIFASVMVGVCRSMKDLRWVMGGLTVFGTIISLVALSSAGNIRAFLGGSVVEGRLQGAFDQPNQLGAFCAVTLFIAIGLIGGAVTRRGRIAASLAGIVIVAGLLLSLSRGAWVGTGLAMLFLFFAMPEFRRTLITVGLPVLLVALLFGAFNPDAPQVEVVGARVKSLTLLSPYDARDQIWAEALREMSEEPITGYGPGSFPVASVRSASESATVFAGHAHNFLLTWGAETGIIGVLIILAFCWALVVIGHRALKATRLRANRRDRMLISGIAGSLISVFGQGFVDYNMRNTVIHLAVWAVVGMLLAADQLQSATRLRSSSTK
jgi:O-antigen ligase